MKPDHRILSACPTPFLRLITFALLLLVVSTTPSLARLSADEADAYYRQGQNALAEGRFSEAAEHFLALSREDGAQVDRALYWQAYAEAKAGREKAALRSLKRLGDEYPDSAWLDDARALELELGGVAAETAVTAGNDDLKLYALDALHQADPDRATELIENFLDGDHTTQLKRHALFILAQTETARAAEILAGLARTPSSPLRDEAIQALAVSDEPAAVEELAEIYRSSGDMQTKHQILSALVASDAARVTADLAIEETDPELRRQAIHTLGAMEATDQIERLAEALGPEYRREIFEAYGIADQPAPLLRVLRESSDPGELEDAIEAMVIADDGDDARDTMLALYRKTSEPRIQQKVLDYLMIQDDAEALIEIFREEDDPDMKRRALQAVSHIDDPRVQSLLEELLKG